MSSAGATGAVGSEYSLERYYIGHSEPPPSRQSDPMNSAINEVSRLAYQVGELRGMVDGLLDHIDTLNQGIRDYYPDTPKVVERARLLVGRSNG